jgi:hypothetical protein
LNIESVYLTNLPLKSGGLNVVDPLPTPYGHTYIVIPVAVDTELDNTMVEAVTDITRERLGSENPVPDIGIPTLTPAVSGFGDTEERVVVPLAFAVKDILKALNNAEYVVLDCSTPSHIKYPDGAESPANGNITPGGISPVVAR